MCPSKPARGLLRRSRDGVRGDAAAADRLKDLLRSSIWAILDAGRGPDKPPMIAMLELSPGESVTLARDGGWFSCRHRSLDVA